MKRYKYVFLGISIFFFILWITNVLVRKNGYLMILQVYSIFDLSLLSFSLMGLFGYIYLMLISDKLWRRFETMIAVLCVFFLGIFLLWSVEAYTIIEGYGHKLIMNEYDFLFQGYDRFYEQENILLYKYVASCDDGEDSSCSWEIKRNQLILTEDWYNGEDITEYDLTGGN